MNINALDLQLERHAQHVNDLEHRLNSIYSSMSWKVMGPVRRVSRALAKIKNSRNSESQKEGQAREQQRINNSAKADLKKFLGSTNQLQFPQTEKPKISIALVFINKLTLATFAYNPY